MRAATKPPLRMRWVRRVDGTVKHIPVCGGGRMYTHTAEGQVVAAEQETGRVLWRRFWPEVYLSFTSPLYHEERLLIPQAGLRESRMRCLDAATGKLEREPGVNRFRQDATTTYDTLGNAVRTSIRTGVNAYQHTYRTYD